MFQKNNVVIGLLPGGIKQLFSANSATKNQSNLDMFSEYENYKSGLIRVNPDTGESLDSIEKISSYFNEADDAAIKFMKDVDAGNIKLKEGETLAQGFTRIYGSGIKKLGESFVDLGKKIGLALGEAALSAGIAWLVSTGIQLIAKGAKWLWDEVFTDNAETKRREESINSLQDRVSANKQESESMDSLVKKYTELNDKINDSDISVTELLQTKEELLGIQDTLKDKYGKEAEAIDLVNGKYDEEIEKLKEIEKRKSRDFLYGDEGALRKDDRGKSDYERNLDTLYAKPKMQSLTLSNGRQIGKDETLNEYFGFDIESILSKYSEISLSKEKVVGAKGSQGAWDNIIKFAFSPDVTAEQADKILTELFAELDAQYVNNPEVQQFKDQLQSLANNIDFDSSEFESSLDNSKYTIEQILAASDDTNESLLNQLNKAIGDYNKALADYELTGTNDAKKALEESLTNLNEIEEKARNLEKFDPQSFARITSYGDDSLKLYNQMIDEALEKRSLTINDRLDKKMADADAKVFASYKQQRDNLSDSEKKAFENLLPKDVQILTLKNLTSLINEAKRIASENPIEIKPKVTAVDTVDSIADLKKAVSSLDDLYNQTLEDKLKLGKDNKYIDEDGNVIKAVNDKNQAIGYADPELLNNVETAFSRFIKTEKDNGKEVAEMSQALKDFEDTMLKFPDDADKVQAAFNDLITAYIDQTGILDDLDESTAKWAIAQLKAMDITNAEAVVMSRLNRTTKDMIKDYNDLREAVNRYNDAVANGTQDEQTAGIEGITNQLNSMYGFIGKQGKQINPFDTEFVSNNLDLINASLDDVTGKFNELDRLAGQAYVVDLLINADDNNVREAYSALYGLITTFDGESIDIGSSLDGNPIHNELEAIRKDLGYTAEEWADLIDQITSGTFSVKVEYQEVELALPEFDYSVWLSEGKKAITPSNVSKYMKTTTLVPKFKYTYNGKGTGANYSPSLPSGGGSSGGGGGGGGGGSSSEPTKPKEEAEESFDWIEVAIQRIEEEIARLDKVVGNSYDFWVKRNEALLKEIDKTKDEIKAQQIAYSEYLRNANAVQVNNGKGLNADDYGENDSLVKAQDERLLAEAKKAWATGEYQKKVQEGLMTGKDIETIQNHFLAETIKTYQELYNKAISAQDAVQDLKIKLGDLARTNFDHVKGEAEDAIAYFESYADLINARIERTEEKGYFATKTFQGALISYEQERLKVLKKEYDDLIAKRDEATRTKAILPYSEEFNKMNQEILEVGKSIEEATTNLVKFNNEMRQHDWDVFDFTQERINNIAEEFDFLIDLLDNQKLYDDYGLFNSRGWADSALHAGKYNAYMEQALQYAKEREKIEADLKKDNADKNLIERREELIKLQQESITNAYAEKEAVKSLVEEGISIHLDALSKLIDEYKTSLKEAKSLYDYQKNIANQTKNITNLQKQLAAYTGDDSEETRALRQRLNKQLEDAQTQLRETQWDKYISETEEFLGDMYEEYEELLNKQLEDIDKLMHDMIGEINTHGSDIRTAINDVTKDVAYKMTENASTFLETGTLVSDFKVNFDNYSTTILKAVGDIVTAVQSIANETVTAQVNGKAVGKSNIKVNTVRNGVDYADVFDINYYMAHNPDLQKAFGDDYDKYLDHFIKYGMKEARQAIETFNVDIYKANYKDLRDAFGSDLVAYYLHYIRNGKREKRKAYAGGSQHINSNQLAWTQDGGGELIYRSSDGAILTPLNIGDKVFTNEMSENLWKLAQLKPMIPTGNARTITNNNAIAITLPNVTNYEQFKTALQNDPKMVGFIQQVTLGEANGSAKLNKRKY